MKKVKANHLLYGAAGLMVLGFGIHTLVDYCRYDAMLNSAPFRLWIYVNAAVWLIPAMLAFLAGLIANKKLSQKERKQ